MVRKWAPWWWIISGYYQKRLAAEELLKMSWKLRYWLRKKFSHLLANICFWFRRHIIAWSSFESVVFNILHSQGHKFTMTVDERGRHKLGKNLCSVVFQIFRWKTLWKCKDGYFLVPGKFFVIGIWLIWHCLKFPMPTYYRIKDFILETY